MGSGEPLSGMTEDEKREDLTQPASLKAAAQEQPESQKTEADDAAKAEVVAPKTEEAVKPETVEEVASGAGAEVAAT